MKLVPVGPAPDQVGVGNQHPRRVFVRAEDADRLARLHQQRLVIIQFAQTAHDGVKRLPVARGLARAAVDDQFLRLFGDFRIQVVHHHPQGGFLYPALTTDLRSAWRFNSFHKCSSSVRMPLAAAAGCLLVTPLTASVLMFRTNYTVARSHTSRPVIVWSPAGKGGVRSVNRSPSN